MAIDTKTHIRPTRLDRLPESLRQELKQARLKRGWSQLELGRHVGLPQAHVSAIETGKTVPRFDTLLDVVRVLDRDLVMVPRSLVPAVQALIRDYRRGPEEGGDRDSERPLYADDASGEPERTKR
ncbi:MAG: helix-turn-helix transcriptional regulator [Myxococcota bacterium]